MSNCVNNTIIICNMIIDYCIKYCNNKTNICYCDCIISTYYNNTNELCVYNMSLPKYNIIVLMVFISIFLYILYSLRYYIIIICKKQISNTNIRDNIYIDNMSHDNMSYNMSHDNISHDNMSHDNMSHDNISHDNMSHDNISYDNMSNDDMSLPKYNEIEHTIQHTIQPINDNILPPPPPYV